MLAGRKLLSNAKVPSTASSNRTVSVPWFGNMLTTNSYGFVLVPSFARIFGTPYFGAPNATRIFCTFLARSASLASTFLK